jgi:integrase
MTMAEWRPAALLKSGTDRATCYTPELHAPLLADLPPGYDRLEVIDRGHPLRAVINNDGRRGQIPLHGFPSPMRLEVVWWLHQCTLNGSTVNEHAFRRWRQNIDRIRAAATAASEPLPVSLLERPFAVWMAAHDTLRRDEPPLSIHRIKQVDSFVHALVGRMCHALNVRCLPLEWWEHDLWVPGLDRRIPLRRVEPTQNRTMNFARIPQRWLRDAARWFCRVGLETGQITWSGAFARLQGLVYFARCVAERDLDHPALVDDPETELPGFALDYLGWLREQHSRLGRTLSESYCGDLQGVIGVFYAFAFEHRAEMARTLGEPRWRQLTPFHATVLAKAHRIRIRFGLDGLRALEPAVISVINAHVDVLGMNKTDTKTVTIGSVSRQVAGIGDPQAMRIYLLLLRLGRRANEILQLDPDPLLPLAAINAVTDSEPAAFTARLRYAQSKIEGAPDTIPIEADVVAIIREQQAWLTERAASLGYHSPPGFLFVRTTQNRAGLAAYPYSTLLGRLKQLTALLQIRDSQGHLVELTHTHLLRHTKATSLVNAGVPLPVIQRYMGHLTPNMTAHYAKLREETIQAAFLTLEKRHADGRASTTLEPSDLYDLLQLDQRTDRILPNGWCLLPPRQVCDKGNACLTCDLFVTDASHLDGLRQQQSATLALVDQRQQAFTQRHGHPMSDDHVWLEARRRELAALELLIASLQADAGDQAVRGRGVPARSTATSSTVLLDPTRHRQQDATT